jgi:hypothetical protein
VRHGHDRVQLPRGRRRRQGGHRRRREAMGRGPGEGASRPRGRAPVRRHRDRRAAHPPNVSLRPLRREPGGDRARQGVLHLPRIRDTPAVRREQRQRVPGRLRPRPRRNLVIHGASVPRSRRRRRRPRVGRDARRDGGHGHRVRGVRRDARDDGRGAGGVPRPGRGALATRNLPRRLRRLRRTPGRTGTSRRRTPPTGPTRDPIRRQFSPTWPTSRSTARRC